MSHSCYPTAKEEGIKQGLEVGELIGRIHTFQSLLKQPETPVEQLRSRSREDLEAELKQLETQLSKVFPS